MRYHRIKGAFLRYFYLTGRVDQSFDMFYWPLIDIMIWGITAYWMGQVDSMKQALPSIMTALVFWQIIWRGNYEIGCNLLQDFWTRNLINLFTSPLKKSEWVASLMGLSIVKTFVTIAFSSTAIYLVFGVNVFQIGWVFLPFSILVLLFGWAVGFFTAGLLIYCGQRYQMLAWATAYLFSPFCAIFYPQSVLPPWALFISKSIGVSTVFEAVRDVIAGRGLDMISLYKCSLILIVYLLLAWTFFFRMFEKSRTKGLMRLE